MLPYKIELTDVVNDEEDWAGQIDVIKKFILDKTKPIVSSTNVLKKAVANTDNKIEELNKQMISIDEKLNIIIESFNKDKL